MEQVHLLIKNAKVFNSYLKKFISANVAVKEGKFYYIDRKQDTDLQTDNEIGRASCRERVYVLV